MRRGLLVVRTERCVAVRFNLPPACAYSGYPSMSLTLVSLPVSGERRRHLSRVDENVSYCHPSTPDVRAIAAVLYGTQDSPSTALLPQPDHMSYETAQKVRQQQVRDRLVYAGIIFLGFVALYINIKRTVKEAAEWEKEHN